MSRGSRSEPGEAHAERRRLRVESRRERRRGRIGHDAGRHDDRGIAGPRGEARAGSAGKEQRVEPVRLHRRVDAFDAAQAQILRPVGLVARAVRGTSISSEMSSCAWPYLIAPRAGARCSIAAARSAS